MSEWLDLMLEEIARKKREAQEARQELQRREKTEGKQVKSGAPETGQSK